MTKEDLEKLLRDVQERKITVAEGLKILRELPYKDIGIAKIDYHRELRKGQPEVIYCEGKTTAQIEQIVSEMLKTNQNILATRANPEVYRCVQSLYNDAEYYETARIIFIRKKELIFPETYIAVVSAGTSDIPVAEEAAVTAELFGNRVQRIYDVGVAGLHRLLG
ncbi:MAG TPA: 1-(5-phosphoribosyl)-5-amino-4-imidazole-carboxylate carboxylase, partial [Clostridiales bacterium]|nr:1-(5-phosphoribosyl)-5-amino-4-imidazole-carboxylate carboxylase [Clostridiales bacterium]